MVKNSIHVKLENTEKKKTDNISITKSSNVNAIVDYL